MCIITAGELEYREYTTIVKALATTDLDIMDLIHRWQEITKSQCKLIQVKKSIDHKLDCRIATKHRLEQQKADILPHVKLTISYVNIVTSQYKVQNDTQT